MPHKGIRSGINYFVIAIGLDADVRLEVFVDGLCPGHQAGARYEQQISNNGNPPRQRQPVEAAVIESRHHEDQVPPESEILEEREYRLYVLGRALHMMSTDFEPSTWKACWETVVHDRPAAEVAAELGITVNAVYLAKSRVLGRLRRDLEGLLD